MNVLAFWRGEVTRPLWQLDNVWTPAFSSPFPLCPLLKNSRLTAERWYLVLQRASMYVLSHFISSKFNSCLVRWSLPLLCYLDCSKFHHSILSSAQLNNLFYPFNNETKFPQVFQAQMAQKIEYQQVLQNQESRYSRGTQRYIPLSLRSIPTSNARKNLQVGLCCAKISSPFFFSHSI